MTSDKCTWLFKKIEEKNNCIKISECDFTAGVASNIGVTITPNIRNTDCEIANSPFVSLRWEEWISF